MRSLLLSTSIACLALSVLAAGPAPAQELSCGWRAGSPVGPDNLFGAPECPFRPGRRMNDRAWRELDEYMQRFHLGLWTAEDVDLLERTPGVVLGVLRPLPDRFDELGRLVPSDELAVVQWPGRVPEGAVFLVAVGGASPADDWVLRPTGAAFASPAVPQLEGPASAPVLSGDEGFFRVHRLAFAETREGARATFRAERVEVNRLGLETELRLTTDRVTLEVGATGAKMQSAVLASGSFAVRTREQPRLDAPVVVNLSLTGPGADLFTLQVLPAGSEPTYSAARNVRVRDQVVFRILASPGALFGGAFLDQVLPAGQSLQLDVQAEIVSFANDRGADLDDGLAARGFSVAPGRAVLFGPAAQLPAAVVRRSVPLEVYRAPSPPEAAE